MLIGVILTIVGFMCCGVLLKEYINDGTSIYLVVGMLTMLIGVFGLSLTLKSGRNMAYKQGQIDALSNNIVYELVEKENLTSDWVLIEKEK